MNFEQLVIKANLWKFQMNESYYKNNSKLQETEIASLRNMSIMKILETLLYVDSESKE